MNNYCTHLNLDINPINVDIKTYGTKIITKVPYEDINTEFIDFLSAKNIGIIHAEVFHNPPRRKSLIHLDVIKGDHTKINFIYGGAESYMCWYDEKPNIVKNISANTLIGTPYVSYNNNEVILVHKEIIQSPSIVQVGVPHNVENGPEHRWCLSFVICNKTNNEKYTFKETVEILKQWCPVLESNQ